MIPINIELCLRACDESEYIAGCAVLCIEYGESNVYRDYYNYFQINPCEEKNGEYIIIFFDNKKCDRHIFSYDSFINNDLDSDIIPEIVVNVILDSLHNSERLVEENGKSINREFKIDFQDNQ